MLTDSIHQRFTSGQYPTAAAGQTACMTLLERIDARLAEMGHDWLWLGNQLQLGQYRSQTMSNWRRRVIPPARHADIAAALGLSVDQLLGLEPAPPAIIATSPGDALRVLARAFSGLDDTAREMAAVLMGKLARQPEHVESFAAHLDFLIAGSDDRKKGAESVQTLSHIRVVSHNNDSDKKKTPSVGLMNKRERRTDDARARPPRKGGSTGS